MIINRDYKNDFYDAKLKLLGNCYTIYDNNQSYYYEFSINNDSAIVRSNDFKYVLEAIDEFRKSNSYITKFKDTYGDFHMEFDKVFTFKLPIKIIQLSNYYLSKNRIKELKDFDLNQIFISVAIIDDEYVLLDGLHRLYLAYINDIKMVNVYVSSYDKCDENLLYVSKENNIKTISDAIILDEKEYNETISFIKLLKESKMDY